MRRHLVAPRRRGRAVQPWIGSHHPLPTQGIDDPFTLAIGKLTTTTNARRGLWRAGCRADPHVRFGRAAWGTGREQSRNRASCRPHHVYVMDADGARLASRRLPEGLLY